jgi:broad specificity phosphatase PhoE
MSAGSPRGDESSLGPAAAIRYSGPALLLVRHGSTNLTAEDRFSGSVGVDLSEEGRRQAGRLAERLADDPVRAVYTSPLGRALETATPRGSRRENDSMRCSMHPARSDPPFAPA